MHSQNRPNILLFVFDSLSEAGCSRLADRLPVLSKFRGTSTVFSDAYVSSPESGPARASLFTGLDMAVHGVWTDGVALPDTEHTFAQIFAQSGYNTWLVGRRQLAGVSNWTTEHARPFEYAEFSWAHGPLHRSRQNVYLAWLQDRAPETYDAIFPRQPDPDDTDISPKRYEAVAALPDALSFNTWIGERTIDLMSQHTGAKPFLGIAGFVVGETMGGGRTKASIGECLVDHSLMQADAALGAILDSLEKRSLADSTIIVVTSGRGSISNDAECQPMQESAIKVPLMIRSHEGKTGSVEAPVSTIDIAPTLFDLAQIPPPIRLQGSALLSNKSEPSPRGWAFSRLRNPHQTWQTALRDGQFKLVMVHGQPDNDVLSTFKLYDLVTDPDEKSDLASDPAYQDRLEAMIDFMIDARVAFEDRTEPRIAKF